MSGAIIGVVLLGALGIGAVALGLKGFTSEGLPLSKTKNICGLPARIIGGLSISFGILLLLTVIAGWIMWALVKQGYILPLETWFQ